MLCEQFHSEIVCLLSYELSTEFTGETLIQLYRSAIMVPDKRPWKGFKMKKKKKWTLQRRKHTAFPFHIFFYIPSGTCSTRWGIIKSAMLTLYNCDMLHTVYYNMCTEYLCTFHCSLFWLDFSIDCTICYLVLLPFFYCRFWWWNNIA